MDFLLFPLHNTTFAIAILPIRTSFSRLLMFSLLHLSLVFASNTSSTPLPVTRKICFSDHYSALLQLKNGFGFSLPTYTQLFSWNLSNTDCCTWEGITCEAATGYVIGLDLSSRRIWGSIAFDVLFRVSSLKKLSLADNLFVSSEFPSGFDQLAALTHLNLSRLKLYGQIPLDISRLTSLVSLDLSYNGDDAFLLKLENPGIGELVQNLANLRELKLDWVTISNRDSKWGPAICSFLPLLQELSLSGCNLSGPIHYSLSQLPFLSVLDLSENDFGSMDPNFISNFSSLTSVRLSKCSLSGSLPSSLVNLSKLRRLDLSYNNFSGPIPYFYRSKLSHLEEIIWSYNLLKSSIPSFLFSHPSLRVLDLSANQLSGRLEEFQNASASRLREIHLGENKLEGPIPSSIFGLTNLETLQAPFNNFSGVVELASFQSLQNFSHLDLSENNLSIDFGSENSVLSFPQMQTLQLRSCNISSFPFFLKSQQSLRFIDLSMNSMKGEIPGWIGKLGNGRLRYLNLSYNALQGIVPFSHVLQSERLVLDLSSNLLRGPLPIPPPQTIYFSVSNNSFHGEIPIEYCSARSLQLLDLSENALCGQIPQCLGEFRHALVLNLGGNNLSGPLPDTFKEGCKLRTLDLNKNQLEGLVPSSLSNCRTLDVLNLADNQISDFFPPWIGYLSQLRILILRNNQFYGHLANVRADESFPALYVIDISGNRFTGSLIPNIFRNWPASRMGHEILRIPEVQLQLVGADLRVIGAVAYHKDVFTITAKGRLLVFRFILMGIDLSNNCFEGNIPDTLGSLTPLIFLNLSHNSLSGQIPVSLGNLINIESLDLSDNNLSGEIPMQLTQLDFLGALNLSHNKLTGRIPTVKQFPTFTVNSYLGNPGLCGPPLTRECPPTPPANSESLQNWKVMLMGFGVGYAAGGAVLFSILAIWSAGRKEYNKCVDTMLLRILPTKLFDPNRQRRRVVASKHKNDGRTQPNRGRTRE